MVIQVIPNVNDVKLSPALFDLCAEKGKEEGRRVTLSALLEEINPSQPDDKLDAFERQLKRFKIVTKDDPDHGVFASTGDLFFQSNQPESRILFPEFIERAMRAAMMDETDYMSYLVSTWATSYAGMFRSIYIDDTSTTRKSGRRGEGAGMAEMDVSWSEKTATMNDYGIKLKMTYEFVRWASLPIIQTIIARAAIQRRYDEASEALYVIENGDGSSKEGSAAANVNLSSYQTDHTGTKDILYKSYLRWLATFNPLTATTLIGYVTDIIDVICMAKPTTDPVFMYTLLDKSQTGGVPQVANLNVGKTTLLHHGDIATNKLLAIDKRFAIQGYRDMGVDLVETNKIIDGKFNEIVISNKVGFAKIFASASKKLTTSA